MGIERAILPVLMSGGEGTRLWPLSTAEVPKQFHALGGGAPLIEETARRVLGADGARFLPPIVICAERHEALARAQMGAAGLGMTTLILEPEGRNTAATAAIAAYACLEFAPEALVLLLPADHVIEDGAGFLGAIERAAVWAGNHIACFGIAPNRPATGYGYIKAGDELAEDVYKIDRFVEKPDQERAERYLREGGYAWNSGMFLFAPRLMLEEFDFAPEVRGAALLAYETAKRRDGAIVLELGAFAKAPSLALDVAIMEQTTKGCVALCDIGWADIGSWDEVWRLGRDAQSQNLLHGPASVQDGAGNLVWSEVAPVYISGVEDLVVIATSEAIVIVPRSRAQYVKALNAQHRRKI